MLRLKGRHRIPTAAWQNTALSSSQTEADDERAVERWRQGDGDDPAGWHWMMSL
jgi:hypothetical protein